MGLYASVAIAMVIAFTGGRPGMISAATAAVAVVVVPLVRDYGVDYLFAATILMGVFQGIAALLRLDLLMQFVCCCGAVQAFLGRFKAVFRDQNAEQRYYQVWHFFMLALQV